MATPEKPNPFRILMLPTDAEPDEIVNRGKQLRLRNPEQARLISEAIEQLNAGPRTRLLHELFEFPDTGYKNEGWQTFVKQVLQEPVSTEVLSQPFPEPQLKDLDLASLVQYLLEEISQAEPADLDALIDATPYSPRYTLAVDEWDIL